MPHPGQMLGDRYRLDDRIAAGGMGEVWQATDTVLGRDVAVKTLKSDRATDPSFQTRFQHEARAMAVLHHPGVADVYDYGETTDGRDAYIVMARVRGEPLNQLIAEHGRLTPAETMSIVAQAARALEAAHQAGIVHRDVKPSNLIVQPDGTVVLVDFGVARSAQSAALTGAKEVVGTALYIAPEQVSKRTTGPPADVYALGAVAYHCLTGHPPFSGDNPIRVAMQHLQDPPPELPGDVPEPVRVLVTTALAKDPADRFASAAAMAGAADAARHLVAGPPDSTTALAGAVDPTRLATATALGLEGLDRPAAAAWDGRGFAPGVADGRTPGAGFPPGAADGRTPGAAGFAAGAATVPLAGSAAGPVAHPGTGPRAHSPTGPGSTSVMPAVAPAAEAPATGGPNRRRLVLLILAAVVIALLALLAALAFASSGGKDDKHTPAPATSAPASPTPSAKTNPGGAPQQTGTGRSRHTTQPTTGSPATTSTQGGGNGQTTTPTSKPSHTPSTAPTTKETPTGAPTTTGAGTGNGAGAGAGAGQPTGTGAAVTDAAVATTPGT